MESALDTGLTEDSYWLMDWGEIERHFQSYNRREERRQKYEANNLYIQSILTGMAVGKTMNSKVKIPPIEKVFPNLFSAEEAEEAQQAKRDKLSVNRFLAFAQSHNRKIGEVNKND